ncbi:hypothetical protein GCM10010389_22980 [Streptomyces echinoruber]|uniref:Uncharacterized protein n=1 Tax=Streptomyces echinoruber TaxID=68898 RepID=A0A918R3I7_9ACTN|nr:hypothetical protein GCM10010389_22980 [Streptomyces echinoruber]
MSIPASARRTAVARPMPESDPVTTATRVGESVGSDMLASSGSGCADVPVRRCRCSGVSAVGVSAVGVIRTRLRSTRGCKGQTGRGS